jgi:hypothetical protein
LQEWHLGTPLSHGDIPARKVIIGKFGKKTVLMEVFHAASACSVVNHDTMSTRLKYLTGLRITRRILTDGDRDENG